MNVHVLLLLCLITGCVGLLCVIQYADISMYASPLLMVFLGVISGTYLAVEVKNFTINWVQISIAFIMAGIATYSYILDVLGWSALWIGLIYFTSYLEILQLSDICILKKDVGVHTEGYYRRFFIVSFLVIFSIYAVIFFTSTFPGTLMYDNIHQLAQINLGMYNNHHPYVHTLLIKLCVVIMQGSYQYGVALFLFIQMSLLALALSYLITLMHRLGLSKYASLGLVLICALSNVFITFSTNLTKDSMSLIAELLCLCFLLKIYKNIGNKIVNYSFLIFCVIFFIEMKSINVYIILSLGLLGCIYKLIKKQKKKSLYFGLTLISIICLIIHSFYPNDIGVNYDAIREVNGESGFVLLGSSRKTTFYWENTILNDDCLEALGVPVQQVYGLYLQDDLGHLTEEEISYLEDILNGSEDRLREEYTLNHVDYCKENIRENGNVEILENDLITFLKIYAKSWVYHPVKMLNSLLYLIRSYFTGPFITDDGDTICFGYDYTIMFNPYEVSRDYDTDWYNKYISDHVKNDWYIYSNNLSFCMLIFVLFLYKTCRTKNYPKSIWCFIALNCLLFLPVCPVDNCFRYILGYAIPSVLLLPLACTDLKAKKEVSIP